MQAIEISNDVAQAFPEAEIRLVGAYGRIAGATWSDVETSIRELEADLASGIWTPQSDADAAILSWHEAYRKFGTNPRRMRPSVDALGRRVGKSGTIPRINPVVDAYNYVSLHSGMPAGAFDARKLHGDVRIRFASDGDAFTPLGEPEKVEEPKPGEVVYADSQRVLTRHWNHRDSDFTKVTDDSEDVILMLERVSADAVPDSQVESAQKLLSSLLAPRFGLVVEATLTAVSPTAMLPQAGS